MRAINLIPADQRRGAGGIAGRTGGVVYVVLATLLVLVALGVVYALSVRQVSSRTTTLAQVTSEARAAQEDVAELSPYVAFQALSEQRTQAIASLSQQRFDWPRAMEQIALALPHNVTLTTMNGIATGGAPTGTTGLTGTTAVGGLADGVSVGAPSLSLAGCASGTPAVAQNTIATTLTRVRKLSSVVSANVSSYTTGGCIGASFNMAIDYAGNYAIPPVHLTASPHSTVGG